MTVFENTSALDQAVKERIRHRISARLKDLDWRLSPFGSHLDDYVVIGGLLGGLLTAPVLGILWSPERGILERLGAAGIGVLVWFGTLLGLSDKGFGRLPQRFEVALRLIWIALSVLLIRILPAAPTGAPPWLIEGVRAGLVGGLLALGGFILAPLTAPLFDRIESRKRWQDGPEEGIVTGLLYLLADVEWLSMLPGKKDAFARGTVAREQRRNALLQGLAGTDGHRPSTRESTNLEEDDRGNFIETYLLERQRDDGSWESLLHEERKSPGRGPFQGNDPEWVSTRRQALDRIETIARYIERGLPAKLGVAGARLDPWLRQELRERAQTIRAWSRELALIPLSGYESLLRRIGTVLAYAAEEQWGAIPKSDVPKPEGVGHRLLRFARNIAIGVIPLVGIVAASAAGKAVPDPLRDSLLTFAIPWILLQIVELVVPGVGESLPQVKSFRELLSAPIGKGAAKE